MLSPLIFKYDGRALRVEKKQMFQKKFQDDIAYIFGKYNPYVFPYMGKISDRRDAVEPGIYILKGETYVQWPLSDEEKEKYNVKNIISLTPESIFKNLDKSDCIEIDTTNAFYGDDEVFKPTITSKDDMALAGMKYAISKKNINFNAYASKFQDQATKNNGRRAITHGTTLKMDMLSRFANVFDIGVALVFYDKQGCINPMDPKYKEAYVIYDSEPTDLSTKEFVEMQADVENE